MKNESLSFQGEYLLLASLKNLTMFFRFTFLHFSLFVMSIFDNWELVRNLIGRAPQKWVWKKKRLHWSEIHCHRMLISSKIRTNEKNFLWNIAMIFVRRSKHVFASFFFIFTTGYLQDFVTSWNRKKPFEQFKIVRVCLNAAPVFTKRIDNQRKKKQSCKAWKTLRERFICSKFKQNTGLQ